MISKKMPIEGIKTDGRSKSDLFRGDFAMWNYADWAKKAIKIIDDKVIPVRQELLSTLERVENSSNQVLLGAPLDVNSVTLLTQAEKITSLDPQSIALKYLKSKALEIRYNYLTNSAYEPLLLDSGSVTFHQSRSDSILKVINELKTVVNSINESEINKKNIVYPTFYEKLGGKSGFADKVKNLQTMADVKSQRALASQKKWKERSKWAVFANDRIDLDSLYSNKKMAKLNLNGEFWPLAKTTDSLNRIFIAGVTGTATNMQGFIAGIADSREGLWRNNFDLYKKKLAGDGWDITAKFVQSAAGSFTCYLFETNYSNDKNASVFNFGIDGKMVWNVNLNMPVAPVSVKYNAILGETIIFLVEENMIAQLAQGQKGYIVIDRNGNVR
jgi:hypothetical protein